MYAVWAYLENHEPVEEWHFSSREEAIIYADKKIKEDKIGTVAIHKEKCIDKDTLIEYNEGEHDRNEDTRN